MKVDGSELESGTNTGIIMNIYFPCLGGPMTKSHNDGLRKTEEGKVSSTARRSVHKSESNQAQVG
jgi:hypothetical protein